MIFKKNMLRAGALPKGQLSIPRSTQALIPIKDVFEDGVFLDRDGYYSKTFSFTDINYTELRDEEKEQRLVDYSIVLNSVDKGVYAKISIIYRPIRQEQFEKDVLIPLNQDDDLNLYREDMNAVLQAQTMGNLGITKESYLTISDRRRNYEDAQMFFARIENSLSKEFETMGVELVPVSLPERLRILHDIYRPGYEQYFRFVPPKDRKYVGMSWKDMIAPLAVDDLNSANHIKIGDRYCRTLFLNAYPTYLDDRIVSDVASIGKPMVFAIDFMPIPTEEARSETETRALAIDTKIVNYTLRQQRNKNFSGIVPYRMTQNAENVREIMKAMQERDQNLYLVTVTVAHFADTLKELNNDTESIMSRGKSISCDFLPLTAQQLHGLNTALPYARPFIQADRLLLTQALAGICPFAAQEIYYPGGSWFGTNAKTKRLLVINRDLLMNGNSMVLATTGGGKSFHLKEEAAQVILKGNADVIFLDLEKEYVSMTQKLGGSVISFSPSTSHSINPLDIDADEDERHTEIPFKEKVDFVMSFCQMLMSEDGSVLDGKLKTLIDRCVRKIYEPMIASGYQIDAPLLSDLRAELLRQPEPEARELALRMEIYTNGSFDMFSHKTNVDTSASVIDYDLSQLGTHMNAIGMLIVLEATYSRLMENWRKKRHTYIYVDEIMQFFTNEYAASYFGSLWQRVRKRGGYMIGATQNTTQILGNAEACKLLENSYVITMLYQSAQDRDVLAEMYRLSDAQKQAISRSRHGTGLIKVGNTIIPFENEFPSDNPLYKLLSTKPTDGWGQSDENRNV